MNSYILLHSSEGCYKIMSYFEWYYHTKILGLVIIWGARGSVVRCGTVLQAGRKVADSIPDEVNEVFQFT
jgi:hypothetical protein